MSTHTLHIRITDPPEVDPVRIQLVVGNEDYALWEFRKEATVRVLCEFAGDGRVTGYADYGGRPPLCHAGYCYTEGFLCSCDVGEVPFFVEKVEGQAEELGDYDSVWWSAQVFTLGIKEQQIMGRGQDVRATTCPEVYYEEHEA